MYITVGVLIAALFILGILCIVKKAITSGVVAIVASIVLGIALFFNYKDLYIDKHEYTVLAKVTISETSGNITTSKNYYIISEGSNKYITTSDIQLRVDRTYIATTAEFEEECKPVFLERSV